MEKSRSFFLGANTGNGFYGLYDRFLAEREYQDVMILKGGPGVGKSSFMKTVACRVEEVGETPEYIYCSGDPDSLDAVFFPHLQTAIVDGTAPHAIEPIYPVAVDRYVDLGRFYDVDTLKGLRQEIITASLAYRRAYQRAFDCLGAAQQIQEESTSFLDLSHAEEKAVRRMEGIIKREFPKERKKNGSEVYRILGGLSCQGEKYHWDTVTTLCPRVYVLWDSYGIGARALELLRQAAQGTERILCPNPERTEELHHILLPEWGLAFVTCSSEQTLPFEPYRNLRLDAMIDPSEWKRNRTRLRFARRIRGELQAEAFEQLLEAKHQHDILEGHYNPHVDFDGVYALAEQEAERLLRRWK